ncbi:MAG: DUF4166 domain-containing protein [Inquilinaceae bacterium]
MAEDTPAVPETVLVLGATGLFGGILARQLIEEGAFDVVCAGRDRRTLEVFCKAHGGRPKVLDRTNQAAVDRALAEIRPFAVVDATGPFQFYGATPFAFAAAAVAAGAHYLDIADAPDFVQGIAGLDPLARRHGVVALSGASTTPALVAAVADRLTEGLTTVAEVESAIVPGNRTSPGPSVMRAVLGQVGQPIQVYRNGRWGSGRGWSETKAFTLGVTGMPPVGKRLAALVDTPDLVLFPTRYSARTVLSRAGLELPLLHRAVGVGGALVRAGLLPSLSVFARPALLIVALLHRFGTDRGGMRVRVVGRTADGAWEDRSWDLIATDGHGPKIPVQPVALILRMLAAGQIAPGARPCLGEIGLDRLEEGMGRFRIKAERRTRPIVPLFRTVLGRSFDDLPRAVRQLHDGWGRTVFEGRADITGATTWRGRMAARLAGFPTSDQSVPARVTIEAREDREVWTRDFGSKRFYSVLTSVAGTLVERFGPFGFLIDLAVADGALHYPVRRGFLWGIPLPAMVVPQSITREFEDEAGRFRFDVAVRFRNGELIAHYRGWLEPLDP